MIALETLRKRIRGWLPKDSVTVYQCTTTRPIWWKTFWSTAVIFTEVLGLVGFLALRIPIWYVSIIGGYLSILGFAVAFYSIRKYSSLNRAAYIFVGMTTLGLHLSVAYTFLLGHHTTMWLSGWFNLMIIVGIQIAGGVVGGLIGKQRNYQELPLGFEDKGISAQNSQTSEKDKAVKLKVIAVFLAVLGVLFGLGVAGFAYVFFVGIGVASYYATVYSVILLLFVTALFWLAAFKLKKIQQYLTKEIA